jgi:hypothetical protein
MDRLYGPGVAAGLREVLGRKPGGRGWLKQVWDAMFSGIFFWCGGRAGFVGDYANLGAQNVVFCVVNVVQTW